MARVQRTDLAEDDLAQIWSYIADDSLSAADRWLAQVESLLDLLAGNPTLGRLRSELAPDLRSFPMGDYVVFYIPRKNGIVVVRVLSGFRNLDDLFR